MAKAKAKAPSAALRRLVSQNLKSAPVGKNGVKKRQRPSKAEKRARRRTGERAAEKQDDAAKAEDGADAPSAEQTEIDNLKKEIAQQLGQRATYVKRQHRAEAATSWEGLTPGLAPVGYDPDESDSDEDPY